jgi:hypothetical protein
LTSEVGGEIPAPGASGPRGGGPPDAHAARSDAVDRPLARRVPGIVFALLVAGCFAAFFLTQRLKHTPTAVQLFKLTPFFSPTPAGHLKQERISFRVARDDEVTVTIVNSAGADVATLVRDLPVAHYKQLSLRWTGRLGRAHGYVLIAGPSGRAALQPKFAGRIAPAGVYRVRVSLRRQHRSVLSPRSFTLVRR